MERQGKNENKFVQQYMHVLNDDQKLGLMKKGI